MKRLECILSALLLALASLPAGGQIATGGNGAGKPEAVSKADSREWSLGSVSFGGLIDGYYSFNFNHPASRDNQLRNFDIKANQFGLNMAKLVMEHGPDPLGFRVDLGFGRAFELVHSCETGPEIFRNIGQAFLSYKPSEAGGLQLDFGKFVTSAGAEVIETHNNWNYSRSLLFAWAIPYYHFGARAAMPFGKHFSAGVSLVNGWNNVEDNNSGKTLGFMGMIRRGETSWTHNYYLGPEKADVNQGYRHLYDTTLLLAPRPGVSLYVNFDYGMEKGAQFVRHGARFDLDKKRWLGVAGAARFALNRWFALAPRLEWFNDADGFMTGSVQKLKELTLTAECKMAQGALTRLEYRRDWSDDAFFGRGATAGAFKHQQTLLVGFVAFFGAGQH